MNRSRGDLIRTLAAEPPVPTWRRTLLHPIPLLTAALLWVVGVGTLLDPIRDTATADLLAAPRYGAEIAIGLLACLSLFALSLAFARPAAATKSAIALAIVPFLGWLALLLATYVEPALTPSMHGKREHCFEEAFLLSLPVAILAFSLLNTGYVARPWLAALTAATAAAALPVVYMQFACMVEPNHLVSHHLAPALIVAATATPLGGWWLRRKATFTPVSRG